MNINIIPKPESLKEGNGTFELTAETKIVVSCEELMSTGKLLASYLKPATGFDVKVICCDDCADGDICLCLTKGNGVNKETYSLSVSKNNIKITAGFRDGIARGIQTFRQLLPVEIFSGKKVEGAKWPVPCCEIEDTPRFKWRGSHLDVSRHFFTLDDVLRFIDQIALHRLNTLHLHLTDDQGWRVEIKKYPKLTQIASVRPNTLIGHERSRPRVYDNISHGGFYTQNEIKKIVEYADERCINVVPEIDMPGHMQAAIHAYPELGCNDQTTGVRCHWAISQHILNPFDSTVKFMQDVLEEIIELFQSEYIHVGGDEAYKYEWGESPEVQKKMQEVGAKDEEELQSWFISQMDKFITSKGRKLIGWDEILEGGLAENAAVMSWRGEKGGIKAAEMKHDVVMAPNTHTYFDHYQKQPVEEEPLGIGGYTPIEKVYDWEPIPKSLRNEEFSKYVLGGQCQLWSEYFENRDKLDYMAFPRICALSEVLWLLSDNKNYTDFTERLETHKKRMDLMGINYCK